jgi:hypothetical protein
VIPPIKSTAGSHRRRKNVGEAFMRCKPPGNDAHEKRIRE